MSSYDFIAGYEYPRDYVVAVCEERLAAGTIIQEESKEAMVGLMRAAPEILVWSPQQPQGWGASPFNLNNWLTMDRQPIVPS
jgi:hypothetical protein